MLCGQIIRFISFLGTKIFPDSLEIGQKSYDCILATTIQVEMVYAASRPGFLKSPSNPQLISFSLLLTVKFQGTFGEPIGQLTQYTQGKDAPAVVGVIQVTGEHIRPGRLLNLVVDSRWRRRDVDKSVAGRGKNLFRGFYTNYRHLQPLPSKHVQY